jgi:hypothetical protein
MLASMTALSACHSVPAQAVVTDAPDSIARIVRLPKEYSARTVTVSGVFAGWNGACRGPVPATRSDWMVEDGGVCLYVTGAMPKGFSAAPPKRGIGEKISVTGKVELTQDGRPYLRIGQ